MHFDIIVPITDNNSKPTLTYFNSDMFKLAMLLEKFCHYCS
jgi:hypothetical protein